jgi:hypothetical protein
MDPFLTFFGLLIGAGVLVGLVAIVGGFLQNRRERLLTHQERLKALELGREIPDDAATARLKAVRGVTASDEKGDSSATTESAIGAAAGKCYSTALWVAFWGFLFAGQNAMTGNSRTAMAVAIAIAASVGAIGVTSMICGTLLAMRTPVPRDQSATGKSAFDSDALDVVSRRG